MLVCTQQKSLPFYYAPTCTQFPGCRLLLHFVSKFEYDATEKLENMMFSGFFFSLSSTLHNGFHNSSYPDIPDTVDKLLFPLRLRMGIYVGRRAIV